MQPGSGASNRIRRALAVTATSLGALWIGALALTAPSQGPDFASWPLALALLAAAAITWLGLLTRSLSAHAYIWVLGVIGLAQLANSAAAGPAWSITSTVTLAALSAGLLITPASAARRAIWVLAVGAAAAYGAVLGAHQAAAPYWVAAGAHVLHVLVDGLLAAAVTQLLIEVADERDTLAARVAARRAAAAGREQARAERLRIGRLLHDTVANTLTVLRRELTADQVAAVRRRCADDLSIIDGQLAGIPDPAPSDTVTAEVFMCRMSLLAEQRRDLGLQVDTRMEGSPDDAPAMPPATVEAFLTIVGEALTNAGKHGADFAEVVVGFAGGAGESTRDSVDVSVRVTDDGPGIPDAPTRAGLQDKYGAIYGAPGDVIGTLDPRDSGTSVVARWSADGTPTVVAAADIGNLGGPWLHRLRSRMRIVTACVLVLAAADIALAYVIDDRFQAIPTLLVYGVLLVALGLLRHLIARADAEATSDQRESEHEAVAEARSREQARIRAEYLRDALLVSRPTLAALADGRDDPRSASVAARGAVVELYVRALLTLAPLAVGSPLAAVMASLAGVAQESEVQLAVAWSDERPAAGRNAGGQGEGGAPTTSKARGEPDPDALAWLARNFGEQLRSSPGATGQLTAFLHSAGGELTLVGEEASGWADLRLAQAPRPATLDVDSGVYGGWLTLSVRWRAGQTMQEPAQASG